MKSKTDDQIYAERKSVEPRVEQLFPDCPIEIIDSYFPDYEGNALQFLGKSIVKMGEADLVVFLPGWDQTRGCLIEEDVARRYGIERLYL
jgi:hypothetical protein